MVIYNVTLNVESEIEEEWLAWMKTEHIPKILNTGFFRRHRFLRLANEVPGNTGTTYAVQYECDNTQLLAEYLENYAHNLQREHLDRYQDKVLAFRTMLEEV